MTIAGVVIHLTAAGSASGLACQGCCAPPEAARALLLRRPKAVSKGLASLTAPNPPRRKWQPKDEWLDANGGRSCLA